MPNITIAVHERNGDVAGKVTVQVGVVPDSVEEAMRIFNDFIQRIAENGVEASAVPNLAVSMLPMPAAGENQGGGHLTPMDAFLAKANDMTPDNVTVTSGPIRDDLGLD